MADDADRRRAVPEWLIRRLSKLASMDAQHGVAAMDDARTDIQPKLLPMATQTDMPNWEPSPRCWRLRRRIRLYVWVEGLSLALLWLGATFWIGLAIDYLPVLLGASEMPRMPRLILLALIAVVLAYVLYRWVFQRAFARLSDPSMAVLLERRFRHFRDGLVTAVEMAEHPEHAREFNQEMLRRTSLQARAQSQGMRVGDVFRLSPLITKIALALAVSRCPSVRSTP